MRTIKCRKCGAEIDASLGECPVCGAIYYVLPAEESPAPDSFDETYSPEQWIKDEPADMAKTQVWKRPDSADGDVKIWQGEQPAPAPRPQQPPVQQPQPAPQQPIQRKSAPPAPSAQRRQADPVVSYFSMDDEKPTERRPQRQPQYQQAPRPRQNPAPQPQRGRPAQQQPPQRRPPQPVPAGKAVKREDYPPRRRSFASTYIIVAIAIAAVLTLVLCYMAGVFDFSKKEALVMPDVVGQNVEGARAVLTDMGLEVKTEEKASTKTAGLVIDQSIEKNKKLSGNETVTLTVSSGMSSPAGSDDGGDDADAPSMASPDVSDNGSSQLITIPNVKGKTVSAAQQELSALGLKLEKSGEEFSDTVAEGLIISQSPESGAGAKSGGIIYVKVSKGKEPPAGHTVTVTAGKGGKVSPNGLVNVADGGSQTFTITPDEGYEVREVKVDGQSVGALTSYTFQNVTGDHTIYAIFQIAATPTPTVEPTPAPTATPAPTPTPTEPPAVEPTAPAE